MKIILEIIGKTMNCITGKINSSCVSRPSFESLGDLFNSALDAVGSVGTVSGYRTTVIWGAQGLGSAQAQEEVYEVSSQRDDGNDPIQPKSQRIRKETK